jgi:phosphatidylglycerophosphate synthase
MGIEAVSISRRVTDHLVTARRGVDYSAGRFLAWCRLTPNMVTTAGILICGLGCGIWILQLTDHAYYLAGLAVFLLGAFGDFLDGSLARVLDRKTAVGRFLDSIGDRVVDGLMMGSIAAVLAARGHWTGFAGSLLALIGSYLVPYYRLQAESYGLEGEVGLGARFQRMVLLGLFVIGGYWSLYVIDVGVWVVAGLTWPTAWQRAKVTFAYLKTLD